MEVHGGKKANTGSTKINRMNLYHDPWFTFCFAEDRIIPRFHLEGVPPGSQISVIKIDPESGERQGVLATAIVGDGGWIDLPQPIIVKAGEGFIAVPEGTAIQTNERVKADPGGMAS